MISSAQGGKFAAGFAAGAFGKAVTLGLDAAGVYGKDSVLGQAKDGNLLKMAGRTTIAALARGAGSALSGGSFANGAVTAAMQHLFNAENILLDVDVTVKAKLPMKRVPVCSASALCKQMGDALTLGVDSNGNFSLGASHEGYGISFDSANGADYSLPSAPISVNKEGALVVDTPFVETTIKVTVKATDSFMNWIQNPNTWSLGMGGAYAY